MLYSDAQPRYFPHLQEPQLLHMGLARIKLCDWLEPDDSLPRFHRHKLARLRSQPATHSLWNQAQRAKKARRAAAAKWRLKSG